MPTFKARTPSNTYGIFFDSSGILPPTLYPVANRTHSRVGSCTLHNPILSDYTHFMSARVVQDFNVFTDNPRIKTYNGIPQKPGYHKPVKPSRALRRLLTAFRYEVKGVSPMEKYGRQFADGKDRKKKTSAKQDYQDSDLGCSSQSAVPYRLAIALNSGRETICSRIIFS